jgi:dihydrofolate synthase/folylpolyglutamate synthase
MNGDSAKKLVETLNDYFPDRKKLVIFGASSDHPIRDMLKVLLEAADRMFAVAARHPRAEASEQLAALVAEMGGQVTPMSNMPIALETALAETGQDDVICVTGSLFLVADAREAWMRRNGLPLPPLDPMIISS